MLLHEQEIKFKASSSSNKMTEISASTQAKNSKIAEGKQEALKSAKSYLQTNP